MRWWQGIGGLMVLLGFLLLFILREALWELILVVLKLIGIFTGFVLIFVGLGILVGGRWMRRPRWSADETST